MKLFSFLPVALFAASPALSHPSLGQALVHQKITLTEIVATTDQDDGGGESEYCVRAKLVHQTHPAAQVDLLRCYDVDWDDEVPGTDVEYHEQKDLRLPLMGPKGAVDSEVVLSRHDSCTPTAPWDLEVQLYEVDYSPAGEIINDVADLIEKHAKENTKAFAFLEPKALALTGLTADAARLAGKWIDRIVNETELLGTYTANFDRAAFDPKGSGSAKNQKQLRHFNADATKTVSPIGACDFGFLKFFLDGSLPIILDQVSCLRSASSPMCMNPGEASQEQFQGLAANAARADEIAPEDGTEATEAGALEMRQSILGLTAAYSQGAVQAQLELLSEMPEGIELLVELSEPLREAQLLQEAALAEGSGALMAEAISSYGALHEAMAQVTRGPDFFERWDTSFADNVTNAVKLARLANDTGDVELAQSRVSQALLAWAALDTGRQEKFAPLLEDLMTLPVATMTDIELLEISSMIVERF
ncbi:MAG: hypothetical protein MK180_06530 [Rhodobacteraceae bacterium]|nr:hypothetical protein [Paracoccaceae bacterium]